MVSVDEIKCSLASFGQVCTPSMRTSERISWAVRFITNHNTRALQRSSSTAIYQYYVEVRTRHIKEMATSSDEATTSEGTAVLKTGYLHKQGKFRVPSASYNKLCSPTYLVRK